VTRRFDSHEYLIEWRDEGRYPAIHDAIFTAAHEHTVKGEVIIDLGASTGLLSRRLSEHGRTVVPVEPHGPSRARGAAYGTWGTMRVHANPISAAAGVEPLRALLEDEVPSAIVARRVFPEIYESTELVRPGMWQAFLDVLEESSVTLIVLEGRKYSARTTHPLGHVDREIAALGPDWRVIHKDGEVAVLERL
jgi:hypothetical protein